MTCETGSFLVGCVFSYHTRSPAVIIFPLYYMTTHASSYIYMNNMQLPLCLVFQKSSIILVLLGLSAVYGFKLDGTPLYEISCSKQCGSYFGRCYKNCFDDVDTFEKRNRACLDECLLRLTTCHHFCGQ